MQRQAGWIVTSSALAVASTPWPAHAHLVDTGFGAFYDGAVHLFATPEDLLPVIALTLWAGLRGPALGRAVLLALPLGWLAGVVAGLPAAWPWTAPLTTAVTTVLFGALAAADSPARRGLIIALAVTLGLVHGGLNGDVLARADLGVRGAAGIACAVLVVASLGAGLVVTFAAPWTRVAVRIAGSWIAATGLLMLGWGLRA